jgi:sulfate adenylyltransferase (ADP) / ATP adenylyltransferase
VSNGLPALIQARTAHALAVGALRPIATERRIIVESGVRFVVRSVSSLAQKDAARVREAEHARSTTAARNPFLPYDPDLFVADLSATHVCLLNKFNVLDHHLLLVTRTFVDQETLLDRADFAALGRCLADIDGLGFYNGGREAGASQPHKHLQFVPGPLAGEGPPVPVEPLVTAAAATAAGAVTTSPALPFRHALAALAGQTAGGADGEALHAVYGRLMAAIGITAVPATDGVRASGPYNLLVTRRWMLAVPRRCEKAGDISINALGFAGSLFVASAAQMHRIASQGPLAVLASVAVPSGGAAG